MPAGRALMGHGMLGDGVLGVAAVPSMNVRVRVQLGAGAVGTDVCSFEREPQYP